MTDYTTGWRRREYNKIAKRRHPWPVWEHPNTPLIITQSPRGPYHIYNGPRCLARNINEFTEARLLIQHFHSPASNFKI